MPSGGLTLRDAVASGRLEDFIRQEEARGVGPADTREFDAAVVSCAVGTRDTITPPRSAGQTSHSPSRGGSVGK